MNEESFLSKWDQSQSDENKLNFWLKEKIYVILFVPRQNCVLDTFSLIPPAWEKNSYSSPSFVSMLNIELLDNNFTWRFHFWTDHIFKQIYSSHLCALVPPGNPMPWTWSQNCGCHLATFRSLCFCGQIQKLLRSSKWQSFLLHRAISLHHFCYQVLKWVGIVTSYHY